MAMICDAITFSPVQDESENVEKLHVSTTEAFEKFKDKSLDGKKADFSDRLRRGRNVSAATQLYSTKW